MLGYPDFQYVSVSNFTTTHFKGPSALSALSLGQFKLPFSVTENSDFKTFIHFTSPDLQSIATCIEYNSGCMMNDK